MLTAKPDAPKSFIFTGQCDPKQNPIDVAKWEIISHLDRLSWEEHRKWQSYQMQSFFTHTEEGDERAFFPLMMDSLKNRIHGHYIRQGKRPKLVWQSGPSGEGTILFIKLNP